MRKWWVWKSIRRKADKRERRENVQLHWNIEPFLFPAGTSNEPLKNISGLCSKTSKASSASTSRARFSTWRASPWPRSSRSAYPSNSGRGHINYVFVTHGQWLLHSGRAQASWQRGGGFKSCWVLGFFLLFSILLSGASLIRFLMELPHYWFYYIRNILSHAPWGPGCVNCMDWAKKMSS